ncbi:MAG TPA: aldehyde dehydrogenase family protein, partial [Euzebyales bacterium]|nr:aldehyde dehydrogenase family protein [Euzebyales bacterium]
MEATGLFVDGSERPASSGATHRVVDPATGEPWLEVALAGADDVDAAVAAARRALPGWARRPVPERAAVLRRAAALARERHGALVAAECRDVGKPVTD